MGNIRKRRRSRTPVALGVLRAPSYIYKESIFLRCGLVHLTKQKSPFPLSLSLSLLLLLPSLPALAGLQAPQINPKFY